MQLARRRVRSVHECEQQQRMLGLWVVIAPIHVAGQQRGRSPLLLCRCCRYDAEKVGVSPGAVFESHFRALNLQEASDVALRAWAICQSHGIFRALDSWHAGSAWRLPRLFRVAMRATLAAHAAFGGASSPLRRESRPSCDGRVPSPYNIRCVSSQSPRNGGESRYGDSEFPAVDWNA